MAENFRQGEVGLRDGDVAEQRLREVVAGARPLSNEVVDLVGAAAVELEALVDQRDVVGDGLAVAREDDLGRHLPGEPQ